MIWQCIWAFSVWRHQRVECIAHQHLMHSVDQLAVVRSLKKCIPTWKDWVSRTSEISPCNERDPEQKVHCMSVRWQWNWTFKSKPTHVRYFWAIVSNQWYQSEASTRSLHCVRLLSVADFFVGHENVKTCFTSVCDIAVHMHTSNWFTGRSQKALRNSTFGFHITCSSIQSIRYGLANVLNLVFERRPSYEVSFTVVFGNALSAIQPSVRAMLNILISEFNFKGDPTIVCLVLLHSHLTPRRQACVRENRVKVTINRTSETIFVGVFFYFQAFRPGIHHDEGAQLTLSQLTNLYFFYWGIRHLGNSFC